jgi:hypothetical protein
LTVFSGAYQYHLHNCKNEADQSYVEPMNITASPSVDSSTVQGSSRPDRISVPESSELISVLTYPSPLDHGLVLLLLSCHHCVVDIWEAIFSHIQALSKLPVKPACQKLQVGSFVVSSPSILTSIQAALIIELAAQLLAQISRQETVSLLCRPFYSIMTARRRLSRVRTGTTKKCGSRTYRSHEDGCTGCCR